MKQQIETALRAFSGSDLRDASIGLLNSLGYQSKKTLDLDNTPDAFLAEFDKRDRKFRKDKALFDRWKSVEFLFQITDDEVRNTGAQGTLFDSGYDHGNYQSYLFFALDLKKNHYTRSQLADITREINLLFNMPAMLLIRHNGALTFSIIDRRLHKKDQSRDVLEKVKLIKDIRYQEPHRAHIEILHDLSLQALMSKHECRDFKQLHEAWRIALDTNELNKKFYRELADWYFWALDHVEFPADVEKDEATRNATSVIRLLTRLIFCWFLKEKGLIPAELFSERKLAGVLKSLEDDDSTFYQAILQNLFFGTLNQRMNTGDRENRRFANDGAFLERKDEYGVKNLYRYQKLFGIAEEEAVKLFSDIPFLNGGLFDCLDKEDDSGKVIYVDGFTRNPRKQPKVPNFLFFSDYQTLDLSDAYGDKKKKKEKVRGLINLLDSYKFTVTENTPIEEEIALDPELLGKVFENLLASYNPETGTTARKQTGSFYTPREIVNYMVDESLIAYLEGQLKEKVPKLAEMKDLQNLLREVFAYTEKVHPFDEDEVEALIDAIDTCKILDPACGSGAFPMGILHKLVFILGKLDPNNDRWKEKQIAKAEQIPDVSAREIAVSAIEKDFETNDLDYGRKLYLIENCIYGVDIQAIAIQISKLRFFISLICDQRTNKNKAQNCGVRPLPNLETKFVAANTLISLDRGNGQLELTSPRLLKLKSELAAVRHRHFTAQWRRDKLALQKRDAEIRKEIAGVLAGGGMSGEASYQLAAWDPYDQNASAPFFDVEWMFGIMTGFDIVIGNPPYLNVEMVDADQKAHYAQHYKTFYKRYDVFGLFYEAGLTRLTRSHGNVTFIVPQQIVNNLSYKKLRDLILGHRWLREVFYLGDKIFEAVSNDVCVLFLMKMKNASIRLVNALDFEQKTVTEVPADHFARYGNVISFTGSAAGESVFHKVFSPDHGHVRHKFVVFQGIVTGNNAVFLPTEEQIRDAKIEKALLHPVLLGRDFEKWRIRSAERRIIYIDSDTKIDKYPNVYSWLQQFRSKLKKRRECIRGVIPWYSLQWPRVKAEIDRVPKILVQGTRNPRLHTRIVATMDEARVYGTQGLNFIVPRYPEAPIYFLLAVLNSTLINYLFATKFLNVAIKAEYLKDIPLPQSTDAERKAVVELAKRILAAKKFDSLSDTSSLEQEIDQRVYKLYGLTEDEIATVEGQRG